MRAWMTLAVALALGACGADSNVETEPSGGSSGSGGAPVTLPSSRPTCLDTTLPTGPIPSARADVAAALSSDGRELVMFGGDEAIVVCGDTPKREHVGDTWILDVGCGAWTNLAVTGPSPRARHSMVDDPSRGRALLFGGRFRASGKTGNYTLFNDVWSFDRSTRAWMELATTGTPPTPRANAAMALDGDTLWVFGGTTSTSALNFVPSNELHVLDLRDNVWTKIKASGPVPSARLFHALTVDPERHKLYVAFGGDANAFLGPFFEDLHVFDIASSTWAPLPASLPAAHDFGRIKLGLALRTGDGSEAPRLHAFGGHDDVNGGDALGNRNDLLTLDLGAATEGLAWQVSIGGDVFNAPPSGQCDFPADFVTPATASVERRSAFAFAPLPSGEAFVVFGGDSDCGRLSDAFWYDTRKGTFTPIVESLPGLTCLRTGNPDCKSLCN
ncbi:MAG: hypothetical protein FJ096_00230 [Deltaproteobacteria bacterium]|nr:hypothetical protein [Deltaproteobacteria bacterium]